MIYNPGELIRRVADQARPPAVYGRLATQDYELQILLDDLVESGAWLSLELKKPFLSLWVNDPTFDNPDLDDPIEELDYNNLLKFAVMEPVVDLESLRGYSWSP